MTTRAATRCWGLVLVLGTAVPLAGQTKPIASPNAPPALPAYAYAWKADLGASGPIDLALGTSMVFAAGGEDGLAAFAIADGRKVWTTGEVGPAVQLTASGGLLFVVTPSHAEAGGRAVASRLDALGQSDGHSVWKIDSLPEPIAGPIVRGNTMFLAAGTDVLAYSANDGFLAWRAALGAAPIALAVDGDAMFVALADRTLLRIDTGTHVVVWRTPLESGGRSIVAADRRVFVCAEDGTLSAYRQDHAGPAIWRIARAEVVGRPAVDDRQVYVSLFDNTTRAYDAGNGTERWRLRLGSRPRSGVAVAAGQVFAPLLNGAMGMCFSREGQPFGDIPLSAPAGDPPPVDRRLAASAVSSDAGVIVRITTPTTHTAWTLTAVKRK